MIVNVFGYAEKLEKSGFTKRQAEASLQILVEIMNQEFATKEDIRQLENKLHSEVSLIRSDMDKLGDKLTIRMGGMMLAGFSVMFALLQIFK